MPEEQGVEIVRGLEGVMAGQTANSHVDGERGRLIYKGYDIHDLAPNCTYEEALWLLWHDDLPTASQLDGLRSRLGEEYDLPDEVYELVRRTPERAHPMSLLQAAAAMLGMLDPQTGVHDEQANRGKCLRVVAKFPTVIAHVDRLRGDGRVLRPRRDLSRAANFLYMLQGKEPSPAAERALNLYWVLTIDHGFGNASTFTSRVIASTRSDVYSAVAGAVGALKGPRHGGAPTDVLDVLQEIGSPEGIDAWIEDRLARGGRIPGLGHRVYRAPDPRTRHLEEMSRQLASEAPDPGLFQLAEKFERKGIEALRREHPEYAYTNVEFYTATLLYYIGIPGYLFASMFAASRVGGWTAHILEAFQDRLIRPRGQYVGPRDRQFKPLDQR